MKNLAFLFSVNKTIIFEQPPKDTKLIKYLATVHANSFPGTMFDKTSSSIYSSDENIHNIYLGLKRFLLDDSNG